MQLGWVMYASDLQTDTYLRRGQSDATCCGEFCFEVGNERHDLRANQVRGVERTGNRSEDWVACRGDGHEQS